MSKQFVVPISDEKRRLKELKYQLYTNGYHSEEDNIWSCYIIDPNNDNWSISGVHTNAKSTHEMELIAIIEGLEWILYKYTSDIQKHVRISLFSNSIYSINLLKEWLKIWKKEGWENRPNSYLFERLDNITLNCILTPKWIPEKSCEYSINCDNIINDMITK